MEKTRTNISFAFVLTLPRVLQELWSVQNLAYHELVPQNWLQARLHRRTYSIKQLSPNDLTSCYQLLRIIPMTPRPSLPGGCQTLQNGWK